MEILTVIWITIPFLIGFSIYLVPSFARFLALGVALVSLAYSGMILTTSSSLSIQLVDRFGVTLLIDSLSGYFILTNMLVTTAVLLYCWQGQKTSFFFTQVSLLHGSVNAVFICADLISLYVALEVISVNAFLLISHMRTRRSIWIGLRYLFISNTAMLFYLIGAALVYQETQSFAYQGLQQAPTDAIALLFLGLLTKGGIFVSGLWLPLTHAESQSPVSALLSGVVVKTGVFPLVRFVQFADSLSPTVQLFSVGTALLGVGYAIFEQDTKRMLAWSTISQLGFVMVSPVTAGFYALTHGLAKASLFLTVGSLPSRKFQELRQTRLSGQTWIILAIASLSISGVPLLAGFEAKVLTLKQLDAWPATAMTIASVGTAIVFAKFLFLPNQLLPIGMQKTTEHKKEENVGAQLAVWLMLIGLIVANAVSWQGYNLNDLAKACMTVSIGWFVYFVLSQVKVVIQLPQRLEKLEDLIGVMSLVLTGLFWMVLQ